MYYTREYLNRAHREIDTIFRVLFPEHGMAVREEQIMLCHKMLDNLLGRNIALCDAGVGIGKTYAYLVACVLMRKYSLLAEGCSPYEQRPVESAIDEVIQMAKLEDVKLRLIRNLSKGYRQRVGLAQAILGFPEIIILDEPTVGLDPKQIIEIRELIPELAKKHTVILSSHILAEIREVCDFILIISKGKLVASDTPDRLEEKMSGTETVEILAKASAAEVRAILLNVEHISNIHTQERADKTCSARIQTEGGCDIREALFFAFAKNECPLLELQTSRISLEEVFLELTQNDAVGEEERTNAGNL